MKTTKIILLTMLISFGLSTIAQVAINNDGSTPDESAMLDVKSSSSGFLTPRMTTFQIRSIINPADGLQAYNTDDGKLYIFVIADNEWKKVSYGTGTIIPTWACGDAFVDDRNSQSYTTVQIGTQCWMAENLNIGTRIDGANNQTNNSTIEKYCYSDDDANCDTYGGLYQWNEMMQYVTTEGVQGICPDGWHLPTDDEWKTMEMALGMSQSEADDIYYRGIDEGEKMKSTSGWNNNGNGTNSSGFTALPGSLRNSDGLFGVMGLGWSGGWWSSTEGAGADAPWRRPLLCDLDQVGRFSFSTSAGYSVRCLKN